MPPSRPAPSSPGGPPRSHHQAWPLQAPEPSPWGSQPLAAQGNVAGSRTGARGSSDPREPSWAPLPSVVCEVSGAPGHPWGGPGPRRAHPQAPPTFREAGQSCPALGLSFPICSVDLMIPSPPSFLVLRISRTEQAGGQGTTGGQDRAILVEPASVNPGASLPPRIPGEDCNLALY